MYIVCAVAEGAIQTGYTFVKAFTQMRRKKLDYRFRDVHHKGLWYKDAPKSTRILRAGAREEKEMHYK